MPSEPPDWPGEPPDWPAEEPDWLDEPSDWLVDLAAFYRSIGFFTDLASEPDAAIAHELQRRWAKDTGEELPHWPDESDHEHADLDVLWYDHTRLLSVDMEYGIPGVNMYSDLLPEFAHISRGALQPERVRERLLDDERVELTFSLTGKRYRHEFAANGDWLDPAAFGFVAELFEARGLRLCVYVTKYPAQGGDFVALTDEERKLIERERGVRFAPWSAD